jgi:hypothetical protein
VWFNSVQNWVTNDVKAGDTKSIQNVCTPSVEMTFKMNLHLGHLLSYIKQFDAICRFANPSFFPKKKLERDREYAVNLQEQS